MLVWTLIVLLVPLVVAIYAIRHDEYEWLILAALMLIWLIIPIGYGIEARREAYTFKEQSQYLENYTADDPLENAALTSKKVELNQWLYTAQWSRDKFGVFSLYPDEVMQLEPIK